MEKTYDLAVIGAGPAGLTAAIYASRYKLEQAVFGVEMGGQMNEIHTIENFPGMFSLSGKEIIEKFSSHAKELGVSVINHSVSSISKSENGLWEIKTTKDTCKAQAILLAMGATYRKMNIPGEKELTGKGVSYCATCDAAFFKEKTVCVVGGGNSAAVVAIELAGFASKVFLISRDEKLVAEPYWVEKIRENEKIELITSTNVLEIKGEEKVEKVILDKPFQDKTFLAVEGVFIEIGTEPGVELANKIGVELDEKSYIKVNPDQSTNVPGVYAAGDITNGSNGFRQVLTAASEASIAVNSIYKNLKLKKKENDEKEKK